MRDRDRFIQEKPKAVRVRHRRCQRRFIADVWRAGFCIGTALVTGQGDELCFSIANSFDTTPNWTARILPRYQAPGGPRQTTARYADDGTDRRENILIAFNE